MLGRLSKATINSMVYSILAKMEIVLEDDNLSEEAAYFLETFNSLYKENKDNEEVQFVIDVLKEEFNGGNDIYYEDCFLEYIINALLILGFNSDKENYFLSEVKDAYKNRINN